MENKDLLYYVLLPFVDKENCKNETEFIVKLLEYIDMYFDMKKHNARAYLITHVEHYKKYFVKEKKKNGKSTRSK